MKCLSHPARRLAALAGASALLAATLGGCASAQVSGSSSEATAESGFAPSTAATATATTLSAVTVEYTERDLDASWDTATAVGIVCNGTGAEITGSGATAADGVVTISSAGTYLLSGSFTGQIVVNAGENDKVQLVLSGLTVTSPDGPAIHIQAADKVFITLAEGTTNALTDSTTYTLADGEDEPNACLYSKADLTLNGSGSLTVTGNKNHGIFSKDDLKITGGTLRITAVNDGLKGKDGVAICAGTITVDAGGDAIQASNTEDSTRGWVSIDGGSLTLTAGGDGIQAETVLQLAPEVLAVTAGGGSANAAPKTNKDAFGGRGGGMRADFSADSTTANNSTPPTPPTDGTAPAIPADGTTPAESAATDASTEKTTDVTSTKGLKATTLLVGGGTITVDSADDALHANGNVTITGGCLTLAAGDDGIHADDTLSISGGDIEITTSYEGLEGTTINFSDGYVNLIATDDGVNAAGGNDSSGFGGAFAQDTFTADSGAVSSLNLSGGTLIVNAAGDGLDSNGALNVSGGLVLVSGPTDSGNGALDTGTSATITGGTVVAAGSTGMTVNFGNESTQPSWLAATGSQSGGTSVSLTDASGNLLLSWTPAKEYSCVVVSCPGMATGESYTLTCGGTVTEADSDGYASGGTLTGGTQVATASMTSTSVSDLSGTMGGGKGNFTPGSDDGTFPAGGQGRMGGTRPDGMAGATSAAERQSSATA